MTQHELALSILDSRFHLTSTDGRMLELVRMLWDPFVAEPDRGATQVAIHTTADGWRLEAPSHAPSQARDPWVFAAILRNVLSGRAVGDAREVYPLHGAAAERDGMFVVLSAQPMAGKTTLLLELLSRGWRLVTDDLVPIDPRSGRARSFLKPLSVRDPERWTAHAGRWKVPRWLPAPTAIGLIPATAFPRIESGTFEPSLLLFSRYEQEAGPRAERLSPAFAAAACAENLHPILDRTPEALATAAQLGSRTPAWALAYGSSEDALELLGKCLAAG